MGTVILLGTGASAGVPVMGCDCAVCRSKDARNRRTRASLLIRHEGKNILVDAGPDLHDQAIREGMTHVDGLLITHTHYDHIGGIEELRVFTFTRKAPIPCMLSETSLTHLHKLFYYFFEEHTQDKTIPAKFDFRTFEHKRGTFELAGLTVKYFTYSQPRMEVTGYRFGDLAYVTDIKEYPESIFEDLAGIKTLVISALRFTPTKLQFSVDEAVSFAQKTGAEMTYLIHMSHDIEHGHIENLLPPSIRPGYDGLEISFKDAQ